MNQTELRLTRNLSAPIHVVYQAWTDPTVMARWFFAGEGWSVQVSQDFRVGGEYSLLMATGAGEEFLCSGVYREIRPPSRLVFTWTSYAAADTLVTLELRDPGGGQTELTLVHEGLTGADVRETHSEGWEGCLANLDRMLAGTV